MPARSCRSIRPTLALVCLLIGSQALAASGVSRSAGGPEAAVPADAAGLLRAAATALQNGDLGRAAALLEQGLTRLEPTAELLAMMADVCRQQGRLDDAATAAEQALDLEPGFAPAHLILGDVYQAMGWFESAAESFRLALAADPDAPAARVRLVRCLTAAGRVREAEAECRRFLAEQETASLTLILGETLQRQQRAQEALAAFDRALQLEPRRADAHAARAGLLCDLGQYEDAARAARTALAIDPGHAEAHRWLSTASAHRQDFLGAYSHAIKAEQAGLDMSAVWSLLQRRP
jgi:tetratricopeptide (TPR) repeat protein